MTAADIVAATTITQVWVGLGGDPSKHGRARAFYRHGDNPQAVSLDDEKGCWFDYRDKIGGGVLDLVQRVLGCDRADAMRWLADFTGLPLDDRPFTAAQRREYRLRQNQAGRLAREVQPDGLGCHREGSAVFGNEVQLGPARTVREGRKAESGPANRA